MFFRSVYYEYFRIMCVSQYAVTKIPRQSSTNTNGRMVLFQYDAHEHDLETGRIEKA